MTVGAQDVQRNLALQIGSVSESISVSVSASDPLTPSAGSKPAREALPKRSLAACKAASTGGNIVPPVKLKDVHPDTRAICWRRARSQELSSWTPG